MMQGLIIFTISLFALGNCLPVVIEPAVLPVEVKSEPSTESVLLYGSKSETVAPSYDGIDANSVISDVVNAPASPAVVDEVSPVADKVKPVAQEEKVSIVSTTVVEAGAEKKVKKGKAEDGKNPVVKKVEKMKPVASEVPVTAAQAPVKKIEPVAHQAPVVVPALDKVGSVAPQVPVVAAQSPVKNIEPVVHQAPVVAAPVPVKVESVVPKVPVVAAQAPVEKVESVASQVPVVAAQAPVKVESVAPQAPVVAAPVPVKVESVVPQVPVIVAQAPVKKMESIESIVPEVPVAEVPVETEAPTQYSAGSSDSPVKMTSPEISSPKLPTAVSPTSKVKPVKNDEKRNESSSSDISAYLAEPINQATKLLVDLEEQIKGYLNSDLGDAAASTLSPLSYGASSDEPAVEPSSTDARQNEQIAGMVDQIEMTIHNLDQSIEDLMGSRRYMTAAMMRSMRSYLRGVQNNLQRLQNRLRALQAVASSASSPPAEDGSGTAAFPSNAFFESLRVRVNRITSDITNMMNRMRSTLVSSTTARPSSG